MSSLRAVIDVLLTPGCWLQNYPYSRAWDDELTWLLDHGFGFERESRFNAHIADYRVWVSNHPYASFTVDNMRPSRATILRAGRLLSPAPAERPFPSDRRYREMSDGRTELPQSGDAVGQR